MELITEIHDLKQQITALQAANKKLVEELEAAGEMIDRRDRWEQAAGEAKAQLREAEQRNAKLVEEKRTRQWQRKGGSDGQG